MQNLSPLLQSFLTALESRDRRAMLELFAEGGALLDCGVEYRGTAIPAWGRQHFGGDGSSLQLIKVGRRDRRTVLTILAKAGETVAGPPPSQFELEFTIVKDGISQVEVLRGGLSGLPAPVAAFINAMNRFDLGSLVEAFAEDALVNDQLQEHWGRTSIRKWAARDIIGQRLTMCVFRAVHHYGHIILTARIDGEYDKRGLPDPLVLTFYFWVSRGSIGQLFILQNYPVDEMGRG